MKIKSLLKFILAVIFITLVAGCQSPELDSSAPCTAREVTLCEDFEDLEGDLGASQFMKTSLFSKWWLTGDKDQIYLYPDFPFDGRSQGNMVLLGNGGYMDQEDSLLYTVELDLANVASATMSYNLIYRTEAHWDGLVVFAIKGGHNDFSNSDNWMVLIPENGYPDTVLINGALLPGYSGVTTIWRKEKIDLLPVLGEKVILGFYFSSDDQLTDWGAALDDIVISAPGSVITDQAGRALDLRELDLKLIDQSVISSAIPRANITADVLCEGTNEALQNGQRPFIKALNDPGERALVLHPISGHFCWVNQEDFWIDGDVRGLERISDLKPEDLFLPVCAASFTPVLTTPGCSERAHTTDFKGDFPPYQIQTALVDEGLIRSIVLAPVVGERSGENDHDPRASQPGGLFSGSLFQPSSGLLWIEVEGNDRVCLLDQDQPGKVICEKLSLIPAGLVELDLCWQGYDELQSCPPGFGKRAEGGCMPMPACFPECPAGYQSNEDAGACVLDLDPEKMIDNPTLCPAGFSVFSEAGCCGKEEFQPAEICPEGYYYATGLNSCRLLPADGSCPAGYIMVPGKADCIPENLSTKIQCTEIEQYFQSFTVSVRESTRCYTEPINKTGIVGSLKPFSVVEVIGLDGAGETLMIKNPAYEVSCWASLADFYTDELDLSILPIIKPE